MKDYHIQDARYAKGKKVIFQINGNYVGRFQRLVEILGGKWVHRDRGFQISPKRLELFERLYKEGWDVDRTDDVDSLTPPEKISGIPVKINRRFIFPPNYDFPRT